jgi:hypothetical protein
MTTVATTTTTITTNTSNVTNGTDEYSQSYEKTTADRAALNRDELGQINLDVDTVVTTALTSAAQLASIQAEISELTPPAIASRFARLKEYGQALAHAEAIYLVATQPAPELPVLHDRALKIRLLIASDAKVLALRGLVDQRILDDLKGPVGYTNTTSDLSALIALYRLNWSKLAELTSIKASDLEEAQNAYQALMTAIVNKAETAASVEDATDQRNRAYALVLKAHDQARRAIMFVRWDEQDGDKYVPSLWAGRGFRPKKDKPVTPAPAPAPSGDPPAPHVVNATPSDPNMPGGSPFTH